MLAISKVASSLEMEIQLNNQAHQIINPSLAQLITDHLGDKTNGVAVAVNQQVIARKDWNHYDLKEKDQVLIIKATQGG